MALYWVGNSGSFNDYMHWSTTDGGPGGNGGTPTASTDVFFTANSFTLPNQVVSVTSWSTYCRDMTWTNVVGNPSLTKGVGTYPSISMYGSLTLDPTMLYTGGLDITFKGTSVTRTINTNGVLISGRFFSSSTGSVTTLASDLLFDPVAFTEMYWSEGLHTNGHSITGLMALSLNGPDLVLDGPSGQPGSPLSVKRLVFGNLCPTQALSNSIVTLPESSSQTEVTLGVASVDIKQLIVQTTQSEARFSSPGAVTVDTMSFVPGAKFYVSSSPTITVQNFFAVGTAGNLINLNMIGGSYLNLTKTSGTVSCDYISLKNSTASGGAVWNAGANSVDGGGNVGWLFAPVTCTYTVAPTAVPAAPVGGTYSAALVSPQMAGCTGGSWTASLPSGSPSWISNVSPASGSGNTPTYVTVSLEPNVWPNPARSTNIVVNGGNVLVSQAAALPPTCTFSVSGTVTLDANLGATQSLPVTSSPASCAGGTWTTSAPPSWLSVSPASGSAAATIALTSVTANTTGATRTATITLTPSSGAASTFVVTQLAAEVPCTSFATSEAGPFAYSTAAASKTLPIYGIPSGCNTGDYELASDSPWLTIKGFIPDTPVDFWIIPGVGPFTFSAGTAFIALEENVDPSPRQGNITITPSGGGAVQTIVFTQAGTDTLVTCTSFSTLQVTNSLPWEASVPSTERSISVLGTPLGCVDGSWTVATTDTWLAVSAPSGGAFNVSWQANLSPSSRTGYVTIGGNPDQTILFVQDAAPAIVVFCSTLTSTEQGLYEVSSAPGQQAFNLVGDSPECVFKNLAVTISDASWMVLTTYSDKSYSLGWLENTTGVVREGTVSVSFMYSEGLTSTTVILTVRQNPEVVPTNPPNAPTNLVATLNSDHTATITWSNGGQVGLLNVQLQIVISGNVGGSEYLPVTESYTTEVLVPNTAYNFRLALVNSVGTSPVVSSNSVFDTEFVVPEAIKPPLRVRATFDDPSQTILLEWDFNGQSGIDSYSIIGLDGTFGAPYTSFIPGLTFTITDLSAFVSGNSYSFKVALSRTVGSTQFTSVYTTSNSIVVVKPLVPRNVYKAKFFNSPSGVL